MKEVSVLYSLIPSYILLQLVLVAGIIQDSFFPLLPINLTGSLQLITSNAACLHTLLKPLENKRNVVNRVKSYNFTHQSVSFK